MQGSSMPQKLRTLVCDDHVLVRGGLVALLEDMDDVEVVGQAGDGDEMVALARSLNPDLVITDVSMRRMSGLDAMVLLHQALPDCRVLVLSMHDTAEFVRQALASGAVGYLLKDSAMVELELAIKAVREGDVYLSPRISKQLVGELRETPASRSTATAAVGESPLTPRQIQILTMIARGKATKEIAYDLGLSVKTVETHRSMIMDRLGIREVAGLVLYAVRNGLVSLSGHHPAGPP